VPVPETEQWQELQELFIWVYPALVHSVLQAHSLI